MEKIKTDYLVVGCGAVGMAFADVILSESDKRITILDERASPGGHWNDAYPFVTLHQPSAFYGVSSAELSRGRVDGHGLNKGMMELATGPEVVSYFQRVLHDRFIPSSRVDYRPMTRWEGEGEATDLATGGTFAIEAETIVDATYFGTNIPALHEPSFRIDDRSRFIPPNDLPRRIGDASDFVVIGGGKTAMDAVVWLLESRVDPDRIRWIRPRDSWLMNREKTQPGLEFFDQTIGGQADQFEAMAAATDVEDLFDRLEAAGVLLRLDPEARPTMFHGATISPAEATALATVRNVIRGKHVLRVGSDRIELQGGEIEIGPRTLCVDCSACAVTKRPTKKVFDGNTITPQMVRIFQPTFSAALIAHVDLAYGDEKEKNRLCSPVPLPDRHVDWIKVNVATAMNQFAWGRDKALRAWMTENRLDGFAKMVRSVDPEDQEKMAILARFKAAAQPGIANMMKLMAQADAA